MLDLNGDGIHTSGLSDPVRFWDVNFDDFAEHSGWTNPETEEAFLWMDLNGDRAVDQTELFGSAMRDPGGAFYTNGFKALERYDLPSYGGANDGRITVEDEIWPLLRLWIDRNHDGRSTPPEIARLESRKIVALHLQRVHDHTVDAQGNGHMLVGSYSRRTEGNEIGTFPMVDVSFASQP